MSKRDLVVEVCHDLINRAMRCEVDADTYGAGDSYTARDCRDKEAAIRSLLAVYDAAQLWQRQLFGERTSYDLELEATVEEHCK